MCERARRPLAYDKMCLDTRPMQHLQQAHTKDRSGRASDADDEASGLSLFHCGLILYECEARRKRVTDYRLYTGAHPAPGRYEQIEESRNPPHL